MNYTAYETPSYFDIKHTALRIVISEAQADL